ncbi:MAG: hypothetical protein GEU80_05690 [Dehalococcoidia bacterium]|nr:hypothetical protein [Dehalococcoidia bacterium]
MGIPYIPTPGLAGSDLFEARHDFLLVPNPFRPAEQTVIVPALTPDVAVIHAWRADRLGNAAIARRSDGQLLAEAARTVIVTAEEVVDGPLTRADMAPEQAHLASIHVQAVVHAPRGSSPGAMPGLYEQDREEWDAYMQAARAGEFERYLDRYVFGRD